MRSTAVSIIIAIVIIGSLGGGAYLVYKKFNAGADSLAQKNPDLNGDGKVNALDLNIELKAISDQSKDTKYDLNNDSTVDDLDTQVMMKAWNNK